MRNTRTWPHRRVVLQPAQGSSRCTQRADCLRKTSPHAPYLRLRSRISSALMSGASPAAAAAAPVASGRPRPPSTRASHSSSTSTLASESAQASGEAGTGGAWAGRLSWPVVIDRPGSIGSICQLEHAARQPGGSQHGTPLTILHSLTLHLIALVLHVSAILLQGSERAQQGTISKSKSLKCASDAACLACTAQPGHSPAPPHCRSNPSPSLLLPRPHVKVAFLALPLQVEGLDGHARHTVKPAVIVRRRAGFGQRIPGK